MNARLDRIIRQGAGAELSQVYQDLARWADTVGKWKSDLAPFELRLLDSYHACEDAFADSERAIEDFKACDGTPAELRGGNGLPNA